MNQTTTPVRLMQIVATIATAGRVSASTETTATAAPSSSPAVISC
ncbi:hypothetical protein [Streptomyces sp. NPDC000880]